MCRKREKETAGFRKRLGFAPESSYRISLRLSCGMGFDDELHNDGALRQQMRLMRNAGWTDKYAELDRPGFLCRSEEEIRYDGYSTAFHMLLPLVKNLEEGSGMAFESTHIDFFRAVIRQINAGTWPSDAAGDDVNKFEQDILHLRRGLKARMKMKTRLQTLLCLDPMQRGWARAFVTTLREMVAYIEAVNGECDASCVLATLEDAGGVLKRADVKAALAGATARARWQRWFTAWSVVSRWSTATGERQGGVDGAIGSRCVGEFVPIGKAVKRERDGGDGDAA